MLRIVLIGAGNVGTHLGRRLQECGLPVWQVYSRRRERAQALARELQAQATDRWSEIQKNAELYILAVSDDAIAEVAGRLLDRLPADAFVVHTSGATPSTVLRDFRRHGVFYPLQTFSREHPVDFSTVPICVSAHQPEDEALLEELARQISGKTARINDRERAILHVAAVFVNNFANHCFQIGYEVAQRENLSFELLQPLIQETARKIVGQVPAEVQTGPAIRGDVETIQRHLDYLAATENPHRELYRLLSKSINPFLEV